MKHLKKRLISLLLASVMLAGCAAQEGSPLIWAVTAKRLTLQAGISEETDAEYIAYADMVYTRPDMDEIREILSGIAEMAESSDADAILDGVYTFYDAYDLFYTMLSLADIRYSGNLTDEYWSSEYDWCTASSSQADRMLEELYQTLAKSPARKKLEKKYFGSGFFEQYDGEGFWDDTIMVLMDEESRLESEYYTLQDSENDAHDAMARNLVDLIRVRQQIAEYCGYDSYPEFANDSYYYRDYTPEQLESCLGDIEAALVPLYRRYWSGGTAGKYQNESKALEYVRSTVDAMGGVPLEAFRLMEKAELYDIAYSPDKYNSSFEVWFDSYQEPFLFMNPQRTRYDSLTLAHEFGHFCNDYASAGSSAGVDVSEFFSQSMEYLSLCYAPEGEALLITKMTDSLSTYVEQACFAAFEQQMYGLTGNGLTVEGLNRLYEDTALRFGLDAPGFDRWEFVGITHFYTNPMYIPSYIVSNDAAMQIYQLEQSQPGLGLERYCSLLDTKEDYFLAFLESAELESPFAPGRIDRVRASFEAVLG